jgi:hypothetical protein
MPQSKKMNGNLQSLISTQWSHLVTSLLLSPFIATKCFFSDVEEEPGWRIVLRTEVRRRRIDSNRQEEEEIPMFAMGSDIDFEGLRAPDIIPETEADPLPTGRNIRLTDILNEVLGEHAVVFDRDVGESFEEGE